ncbi:MAG: glyoxalase family protein [Osedax symbiont Rs2]|nr:MAG: glyoxalase family protein [Osedax symbiont Rs2]
MNKSNSAMVPELTVTDFSNSLDFYTNTLGFKVRNLRENPNFAYLIKENVQLMLEQSHEDGWNIAVTSYPMGNGINLQMQLIDIEPLYQRLKADKIVFYRELKEVWYDIGDELSGRKEFLLQDPDGYLLRFSQFLGERNK